MFDYLKDKLTHAPILTVLDGSLIFYIDVDIFDSYTGMILIQFHEGKDRPIYHASGQLNHAEKNYIPIEREALGMIYANTKVSLLPLGKPLRILYGSHHLRAYMKSLLIDKKIGKIVDHILGVILFDRI